jgi:hypothetical protein
MMPEKIALEDKIMKLLIEIQDLKMRLVKDENFQDAGIVREAQKVLRLIVKAE